jgi:hypothetical protein
MKLRNGFVSNSSSCSFLCCRCNHYFSGWDWDDDPVCPACGEHIYANISPDSDRVYTGENFVEYLCKKYRLNQEKEFQEYKDSL